LIYTLPKINIITPIYTHELLLMHKIFYNFGDEQNSLTDLEV